MSGEIRQAIEDAAKGPARVTTDAGTVEQPRIPDIIEADKYLAAKDAVSQRRLGIRFRKLIPPGAV